MDSDSIHTLPAYEHSGAAAPSYSPGSTALTLTIDPTGLFIKSLPSSEAEPLYTLNHTLLHVSSTASVHITNSSTNNIYAIAEHFISPIPAPNSSLSHARRAFQYVTAARSHGALVTLGAREIVWDFSTRVPLPPGSPDSNERTAPVDPVYMIGNSPPLSSPPFSPSSKEQHHIKIKILSSL